jgi:very-short-patch-repair endonuclease
MPHSTITPLTRKRAQSLRREMTKAEKAMWSILKDFNAEGASFRRETPIGVFITDFAWLSRRLVIEVDGDSHETEDGKRRDRIKDAFLTERGFVIMRFDNHQVIDGPDFVVAEIENFLLRFNSI